LPDPVGEVDGVEEVVAENQRDRTTRQELLGDQKRLGDAIRVLYRSYASPPRRKGAGPEVHGGDFRAGPQGCG
jgi:hypothetical protein